MTSPRNRTPAHRLSASSPVALIVSQLEGEFYTIGETAEITGVPISTLRRWYRTGITKAPSKEIQIGQLKIYLYTPEDHAEIVARRHPNIKIKERET